MKIEKGVLDNGVVYYTYATRSKKKLTGAVSVTKEGIAAMIERLYLIWKQ